MSISSHDGDVALASGSASAEPPTGHDAPHWGNLWQAPSIIISAVLIVLGIRAATGPDATIDPDAVLTRAEELVAGGELKSASEQLKLVEPVMRDGAPRQQARFHILAADVIALAQQIEAVSESANNRSIDEHYSKAVDLDWTLTPTQLERWASALVELGQIEQARLRLSKLDEKLKALNMPPGGGAADSADLHAIHQSRNRVFRRIVEAAVRRQEVPRDDLLAVLADFKLDPRISASDELWTAARQAEIRLSAGFAQQAVDSLLVDIRRAEGRGGDGHGSSFGDLYTLLGRGYWQLGDYARAQRVLEHALTLFTENAPAKGEALVLLGELALSRGELDVALEKFHLVARDFVATPSYAGGLLGRAEVQSVLGEHEASQADYTTLRQTLAKPSLVPGEITPERVAESLCDRHDAALAMGKLDLALQYAHIAESYFEPESTPAEVLFRLASTSRQIAADLIRPPGTTDPTGEPADVHPTLRHEANIRYERAGGYYLRHANAHHAADADPDDWATSLWLAADSFDLAGRQDLAIEHFTAYLDRRPIDDNRRVETLMRLAKAHHALLAYDRAMAYYRQVIESHDRSSVAAECYVPLARCYLAVNQRPEAQQLLRQVLSGDRLLGPEARDYRDAIIDLGRMHYDAKEFASAIERFTEARDRYPNDPRRIEVVFMLADSYRAGAMAIRQRVEESLNLPHAEAARLAAVQAAHLQAAQGLFAELCDQPVGREPALATSASPAAGVGVGAGPGRAESLEAELVRRACYYRADCAFFLEAYAEAIDLYDAAARQYSSHHSSMYALIQIVNSYSALGDSERANAAHHRALVRLRQLPESAFDGADALLDRAAWERWLENNPVDPGAIASVSAATP